MRCIWGAIGKICKAGEAGIDRTGRAGVLLQNLAKPKTKHGGLGIGVQWKPLTGTMVVVC
jgi:hypothetical protein